MKTVCILAGSSVVLSGFLACSEQSDPGESNSDLKGSGNSQSQVTFAQLGGTCGQSCIEVTSSKDVGFIAVDATDCGDQNATLSLHSMDGGVMGPAIDRTPVPHGNGKACPNIAPDALKYDDLGGHRWAVCVSGANHVALAVKSGQTCAAQSFAASCAGGATGASTGEEIWRRDLGLGTYYVSNDVATDPDGNVIHAQAPLREGTGSVIKLDGNGNELWRFGHGSQVATDANGNVYVAGAFTTPTDVGFGTMTSVGGSDVFLVKLDRDGHFLWGKEYEGPSFESVHSIAVGADRIVISGFQLGTLMLDGTGNVLFTKPYNGAVAFDSNGNLLMSGGENDDFGLYAYVRKLDPSGNELWKKTFHDATDNIIGSQMGTAVAVAPNDDVLIGGYISMTINLFGRDYVMPDGHPNGGYLSRLDPSGNELWTHVTIAQTLLVDIATDSAGNVIMSGAMEGNVLPFHMPWIAKYDPNGVLLMEHQQWPTETLGYGVGHGVAVDGCDNIYWTVTARLSFSFEQDVFLLKITP